MTKGLIWVIEWYSYKEGWWAVAFRWTREECRREIRRHPMEKFRIRKYAKRGISL